MSSAEERSWPVSDDAKRTFLLKLLRMVEISVSGVLGNSRVRSPWLIIWRYRSEERKGSKRERQGKSEGL
jgi:hypothetical protein